MADYTVEIKNTFEAENWEDAVGQMATWLTDNAYHAGYRVYQEGSEMSVFIDADDIDWDQVNSDVL